MDSTYYVVSGVVQDLSDSHLRNYPIYVPFESLRTPDNHLFMETYQMWGTSMYIMTYPEANLAQKEADINRYAEDELDLWTEEEKGVYKLSFNSLEYIYLSEARDSQNYFQYNDPDFLRIIGVTALLILVFAGVNYLNLSVALAGFRAKSAAIQRLLGSSRGTLFLEFHF